MPQLKFAPDMCIFLLASFFMTLEVLACFSDIEHFYHFLFISLISIGECVSVREKILDMNIKTSVCFFIMNYPVPTKANCVISLKSNLIVPSNIRAMLNNCLRVPCTLSTSSPSCSSSTSSLSSSYSIQIQ